MGDESDSPGDPASPRQAGRTEREDLVERLRAVDFRGDAETARYLRMEAQRTVDKQVTLVDDIDSKAIRILRVNVLLVGLILTALSFVSRTEYTEVGSVLNVYTGVGILSLVLSSAFAALTFTASDLEVGVDPDDVALLLGSDPTPGEFEEVVAKSYATWIRFNERTTVMTTPLISSTVFMVIAAIAYLSLGVYVALVGPLPVGLETITHSSLVGIAVAIGLPWQVRDACLEAGFLATIIDFFER